MTDNELHRWLEYYQDLGFKQIYRREPAIAAPQLQVSVAEVAAAPQAPVVAEPEPVEPPIQQSEPTEPKQSTARLPDLAPAGDTLEKIREDLGECRRCRLHEGRNKLVFGVGDANARLVFVGEGPGADED
ncbi:MAG TPA: hypothetical protein VN428_05455, partial [Bryobacteraceae bacterium]|nr:hypothetical protein [Bryobacteraceae bacterium]